MAVTLDDGHAGGRLLIGADGVHSVIRALAFGPEEDFLHYRGSTGSIFLPRRRTRRLIGDRFAVTDTRNEAMFFYRLRDGTITAMAVHRSKNPEIPADPRTMCGPEDDGGGHRSRRAAPRRRYLAVWPDGTR